MSITSVSFVYNRRRKTKIPLPRGKQDPPFSFSHKHFREDITNLYEERKIFSSGTYILTLETSAPSWISATWRQRTQMGLPRICPSSTQDTRKKSISDSEPLANPSTELEKEVGMPVSAKPPHHNWFTEMSPDDSLEYLSQSAFSGTVDGLSDGVNE